MAAACLRAASMDALLISAALLSPLPDPSLPASTRSDLQAPRPL